MAFEIEKKANASLGRIGKTCKAAYYLIYALFIIVSLVWIALFLASSISLLFPGSILPNSGIEPVALIGVFVSGIIVILTLWIAKLIFRDIGKGETPFTLVQAKRIRRVSYLLIAKVIFEMIFPVSIMSLFTHGNVMMSYEVTNNSIPVVNINIEVLIFAIIFYCLSLVFQYGVLLQQDSDDFL